MSNERVAIEDIIEASARGALRALDARREGEIAIDTAALIRAGFFTELFIRSGGHPIIEASQNKTYTP